MKKQKVLIVDDQIGICILLQEVIKSQGYTSDKAMTGEEALQKVNEINPDMIFLDYNLPIISGGEVVKRLAEQGKKIPIILMSGDSEDEVKKKINPEHIKDVLAKPFDIEDVNRLLKENLL